jgi:hypothetical protein
MFMLPNTGVNGSNAAIEEGLFKGIRRLHSTPTKCARRILFGVIQML